MMCRVLIALASALFAVACGGGPPPAEPVPDAEATAGDDVPETTATEEPVAEGPRSTTPVPVPQPAVPREQLSQALQDVWTSVEAELSVARPEGLAEVPVDDVEQVWADGPFVEWVEQRRAAAVETRARVEEVPAEPSWERAVAAALWAHSSEDFAAQMADAPMPASLARDGELRGSYVASMDEATSMLGALAAELYALCEQRLAAVGDESPWLPWRAYCVQRGREVTEAYHLAPPDGEASPASAE